MRAPLHARVVASLKGWWGRFRQRLRLYEQRNLAEWQYWGKRRAERELGGCPDLIKVEDCCEHCDCPDCRDRRTSRAPAQSAHPTPPLKKMGLKAIW